MCTNVSFMCVHCWVLPSIIVILKNIPCTHLFTWTLWNCSTEELFFFPTKEAPLFIRKSKYIQKDFVWNRENATRIHSYVWYEGVTNRRRKQKYKSGDVEWKPEYFSLNIQLQFQQWNSPGHIMPEQRDLVKYYRQLNITMFLVSLLVHCVWFLVQFSLVWYGMVW